MSALLDAVVVGSGHNALVSAAYLAREGWSVEVLEKDTVQNPRPLTKGARVLSFPDTRPHDDRRIP